MWNAELGICLKEKKNKLGNRTSFFSSKFGKQYRHGVSWSVGFVVLEFELCSVTLLVKFLDFLCYLFYLIVHAVFVPSHHRFLFLTDMQYFVISFSLINTP